MILFFVVYKTKVIKMRNAMWVGGGISGMGEIPMLGVKEKGIAKVIRDIFRNGEKGFFYDPSDLKTQYQDSAGTTAVSASGQPVGLMLDKSKGLVLGEELASVTEAVSLPIDAVGGVKTYLIGAVDIGKTYQISFTVSNFTGSGDVGIAGPTTQWSDGTSVFVLSNGTKTCIRTKLTTREVYLYTRNTAACVFSNISIKEIKGHHAYQTTSAARPILRQTPILGSELVVNGDFTDTTKFTKEPGWTVSGGNGVASNVIGNIFQSVQSTIGKTYLISGEVLSCTVGSVRLLADGTNIPIVTTTTPKVFSYIVTASLATIGIGFRSTDGFTGTVDNLSVKEILGYRTDQNRIVYDGVDDKLVTNLSAPLSNATVLRSVPNVGTQVKYNQTLPMLYEDSTNHSGLIAIDRALTRQEQLRLMTELDKKAGATSLETLTFKAFDNKQEGFVYDPNDLSTMYQDAAGTVPVTSLGQPVGLILDKKSPALVGGEVDVDVTNWLTSGGINKLNKNTFSNPAAATGLFYDGAAIDGLKIIELHYTVTGGTVQICDAVGTRIRAESTQPSGVLKATFYPDRSSSPLGRIYFRFPTAGTTLVINKLIVHTYTGNHAYQTTSASRPILRKNAETGANYLEFDGSDDFLQTGNIDFTATDKVSLFAGVRNYATSTVGVLAELSSNADWSANTGSFYLAVPSLANFRAQARGALSTASSVSVPINSVANLPSIFTAKYDLASKITLRLDSLQTEGVVSNVQGRFKSYPLYIGRRGGTTYPFKGHVYGLIGIGKLVSDSETTTIEKELSKRVGVTLNV